MKKKLLTPQEKAEETGLSVRTLKYYREIGVGPEFKRFSQRIVRYFPEPENEGASSSNH